MKPPQIAGTVLFLLLSSFAATQQPLLESIPQQYSNRPFVAYKSVAPYWTLEPGWHTEIELGNNLVNRDITVHPVLTTFDGRQIELDAAVVRPGEMRVVDLRQSVQAIAANLVHRTNSFGSIILRYDALSAANLYASVMIYRDGTPVAFHMPAEDEKIPRRFIGRDGVWWLPRPSADGYVIVTNPNPVAQGCRTILPTLSMTGTRKIRISQLSVLTDSSRVSGPVQPISEVILTRSLARYHCCLAVTCL